MPASCERRAFFVPVVGHALYIPFSRPFLALTCFRSARPRSFSPPCVIPSPSTRHFSAPRAAARHPVRGILPHPTFLPKITAATVSRPARAFFIRPLRTHFPRDPQRTAPVPRLFQCCFAPLPSTTVVLCGVVLGSYCRKMPPTPTKNGNSGGKAAEAGFCGKFFALRFFPCYAIIRTRKKDKEKKS